MMSSSSGCGRGKFIRVLPHLGQGISTCMTGSCSGGSPPAEDRDLREMVGVERFELPTLWSQTRCATRLRYTPNEGGNTRFTVTPQYQKRACPVLRCGFC